MQRWFLFAAATMLLWGGWGLVSKPVSSVLSPWQVQVISAAGLLPVIAGLLISRKCRGGTRPGRSFWLAFISGIVASLGNVAYYQALAMGGKAAAVTPLTALYPVVTILMALVLLRERLNWVQGGGIGLSLAALYCFNVAAGTNWLTSWLGFALVPIVLWGGAAFLQKLATAKGSAELVTLGFLVGDLPLSFVAPLLAPMSWELSVQIWGLTVLLGLLFGLGNLTLISAYGIGGKASVVTPMASLYSVVTVPLSVLILGERVGTRELAGIILALVAVACLVRERPGPATPTA
jgi:drug/metabolite transporter (DMT)-like permease